MRLGGGSTAFLVHRPANKYIAGPDQGGHLKRISRPSDAPQYLDRLIPWPRL